MKGAERLTSLSALAKRLSGRRILKTTACPPDGLVTTIAQALLGSPETQSVVDRNNPWNMSPSFEGRLKEGLNDLFGHFKRHNPLADSDTVGIVVGAG